MATCYLIIGTPRSGTNAVAGVLHHLGVFMGERFEQANEWNEKGFFSDLDFSDLYLNHLLDVADGVPHLHSSIKDDKRDMHQQLIDKRKAMGVPWGIAGMETLWAWPLLERQIGDDLKYLVVRRPFHETVQSWSNRAVRTLDKSVREMGRCLYVMEEGLQAFPRDAITVNYHDLLRSKETEIGRIADFIGVQVTQAALSFIEPSLRRFGGAL